MIMIDVLVQGTISGGGGGSPNSIVPLAEHINGAWWSHVLVTGLLEHEITVQVSTDDGVTYAIDSEGVNASIGHILGSGVIPLGSYAYTHSGNTIEIGGRTISMQSLPALNRRSGDGWENFSTASLPGASFAGGEHGTVIGNYAAPLFVLYKRQPFGGPVDVFTSSDGVTFTNPTPGVRNPIVPPLPAPGMVSEYFTSLGGIIHHGGGYIAYGQDGSGDAKIATSPDLANWTKLPGAATFTGVDFRYAGALFTFSSIAGVTRSTDGINGTFIAFPVTPISTGFSQPFEVLITATRVEIYAAAYVYISLDGVSWTAEILQNNLRPQGGVTANTSGGLGPPLNVMLGRAKGDVKSTTVGPAHISLPVGRNLQNGGKTVHLANTNAQPTLGYPLGHPGGDTVGWMHAYLRSNAVTEDSYTINNLSGAVPILAESLYARSSATTRYFEVTAQATSGTANRVGAAALGGLFVPDVSLPATDAVFFHLENDLITVSNTNDIVVVHTHTDGQIIGFLFDFTAQTCDITVDGVALATVPNLTADAAWVAQSEISDGRFRINVGNEAFSHNTTLATAWETQ